MVLRPLLAAAAIGLLVFGLGYWQSQREAAARRLAAWEERQADELLRNRLDRVVTSSGGNVTLAAFADWIAEKSGLDVDFDDAVVVEAAVFPNIDTITLPAGRMSLQAILKHALDCEGLTFDLHSGRLHITTPEAMESRSAMYLVVYPLPQPNLTTRDATAEIWGEVITTSIAPQTWDDVGGPAHLTAVPGGLVVYQTREIHQQIQALLDRLGSLDNPPTSWEPVYYPGSDPSPLEQEVLAALEQPFEFTFDTAGLPMDEFFRRLADEYEIPIVLDRRKLAEAGVLADTPVEIRLRGAPLRSALRLVLNDLELTYLVRDDALVITTPEEAESCLTTVVYPVHDLVLTKDGLDSDPLVELVTSTVSASSWDEVGGPGSLQVVAGGWMIVSHYDEVHTQLRSLLTLARQARTEGGQRPFPLSEISPAERAIEAALEKELPLSLYESPLRQVARDLTDELGISVYLDTKRLDDAGIHPDTPVTCDLPAAPLRMQLQRLLRELDLTFVVRDDVLAITTHAECEARLDTYLYDVRPLVDNDLGILDDQALIDLLTKTIDEQSWDNIGGPGSLAYFQGLLVVTQTRDVHRKLAGLLMQLERHCLRRIPRRDAHSATIARILPDPAEEQLETALLRPISVEFDAVPLETAVAQLSQQTGAAIVLDRRALENAGYSPDTEVSFCASEMTLGGVLDRLLGPLLSYAIWNRQIVISYPDDFDSRLHTRLYHVADMFPSAWPAAEIACDQLMNDVEPSFWDISGGPGSYVFLSCGWLIVTADTERHMSLADRLHELRTGQKTQRALEREEQCAGAY
jgi:hypothetical protein